MRASRPPRSTSRAVRAAARASRIRASNSPLDRTIASSPEWISSIVRASPVDLARVDRQRIGSARPWSSVTPSCPAALEVGSRALAQPCRELGHSVSRRRASSIAGSSCSHAAPILREHHLDLVECRRHASQQLVERAPFRFLALPAASPRDRDIELVELDRRAAAAASHELIESAATSAARRPLRHATRAGLPAPQFGERSARGRPPARPTHLSSFVASSSCTARSRSRDRPGSAEMRSTGLRSVSPAAGRCRAVLISALVLGVGGEGVVV